MFPVYWAVNQVIKLYWKMGVYVHMPRKDGKDTGPRALWLLLGVPWPELCDSVFSFLCTFVFSVVRAGGLHLFSHVKQEPEEPGVRGGTQCCFWLLCTLLWVLIDLWPIFSQMNALQKQNSQYVGFFCPMNRGKTVRDTPKISEQGGDGPVWRAGLAIHWPGACFPVCEPGFNPPLQCY